MTHLLSIFEIAGPVMIGPSSSHTGGACKIGQFARAIFHGTPKKVVFYLHGSFGEVYKGHATDKALLAGILKMRTRDPRLPDSFEIAKEKGLEYKFVVKDLGKDMHPNTVEIVMSNKNRKMSVTGSSIGGGMIQIVAIDGFKVDLHAAAGRCLSFIMCHQKGKRKVIEQITAEMKKMGIFIDETETTHLKDKSLTIINTEGRRLKLSELMELEKKIDGIEYLRSLSKLEK